MAAGISSDRANTRPPSRPSVILPAAIGVVGLAIAVLAGFPSLVAVVGGSRADGTVVELLDQGWLGTTPVVSYQVHGTDYRVVGSVDWQRPGGYTLGEAVPIIYPPGHPAEGLIDSFRERWMATLVYGGLGLVALLGAGLGLRDRLRRTPRCA